MSTDIFSPVHAGKSFSSIFHTAIAGGISPADFCILKQESARRDVYYILTLAEDKQLKLSGIKIYNDTGKVFFGQSETPFEMPDDVKEKIAATLEAYKKGQAKLKANESSVP